MRQSVKGASLTVVTAAQVLALRRETLGLREADGAENALRLSAALLALSLRRGGERVFADGGQVLQALSLGQVRRLAAAYERLDEGAELDTLFAPEGSGAAHAAAQERALSAAEENPSFDRARFDALRAQTRSRAVSRAQAAVMPHRAAPAAAQETAAGEGAAWSVSAALERDARRYDGAYERYR